MGRGLLVFLIGNRFAYDEEDYLVFKKILHRIPKNHFKEIYGLNDIFLHDVLHLAMVKKDYKLFKEMFKYVISEDRTADMDVFNYDLKSPPPYIITSVIESKNYELIDLVMKTQHIHMKTSYVEAIHKTMGDLIIFAEE